MIVYIDVWLTRVNYWQTIKERQSTPTSLAWPHLVFHNGVLASFKVCKFILLLSASCSKRVDVDERARRTPATPKSDVVQSALSWTDLGELTITKTVFVHSFFRIKTGNVKHGRGYIVLGTCFWLLVYDGFYCNGAHHDVCFFNQEQFLVITMRSGQERIFILATVLISKGPLPNWACAKYS